jgi:L-ascorbate metabolism protein UlaG (beta-lactamase superfamily)
MANRLTWLGHSTVVIELDGTRVVTDPVLRRRVAHLIRVEPVAEPALEGVDVAVISHVHWDHLDVGSLRRLGAGAQIVVPQGAGRLLSKRGFTNVVEIAEGSELELGAVRLRATHAEHDGGRGPLGITAETLGYVIEGSRTVYFAGDTDLFAEMDQVASNLDVALVPIAGWGHRIPAGHLDPDRAAEAVRRLRPRRAIPVHWGTYRPLYTRRPRGPDSAPERFAARVHELAPEVEVSVLQLGESAGI